MPKTCIFWFKIKKWAEARRKGEKVKKPQPVALSNFIRRMLMKVHSEKKNFFSILIKITPNRYGISEKLTLSLDILFTML